MKMRIYTGVHEGGKEEVYAVEPVPNENRHQKILTGLKQDHPEVLMWLWKDDE